MDQEDVILKIHGMGEIPADGAAETLNRINRAYNGLAILDLLTSFSTTRLIRACRDLSSSMSASVLFNDLPKRSPHLELKGVVLQSPGFWEFIGKLNPLEAIRLYLNDRHERKKDNSYRNESEKRKLTLENKLLEIKIVNEFVDAARNAGVPENEIQTLVRENAVVPLLELEAVQDRGGVTYAELPSKVSTYEEVEEDA